MQQLGINQAQVVGLTGKSKGSISMYLNDKTTPSEQVQSDIAVSLGLNPDYFEQEETPVTFKPSKCEDGIPTLTVHEVAKLMHKHTNTIALGLQQGDSKKAVVITSAITVVNAMGKLYETVTVA